MTKANLTEMLDRLERAGEHKPKTIDELRVAADETVKAALHGCGDAEHMKLDNLVADLIRKSFKLDLLPDRVRDPFVQWMACEAAHGTPEGRTFGDNLKELMDGAMVVRSLHLAYFIAALYDRPDLVAPSTVKPTSVGQYL